MYTNIWHIFLDLPHLTSLSISTNKRNKLAKQRQLSSSPCPRLQNIYILYYTKDNK